MISDYDYYFFFLFFSRSLIISLVQERNEKK